MPLSSKQQTLANNNLKFKCVLKKKKTKLSSEEELQFEADSRMITIISINLYDNSLLRKKIV
jgi:hypothetical protein